MEYNMLVKNETDDSETEQIKIELDEIIKHQEQEERNAEAQKLIGIFDFDDRVVKR
jgi:hypothetical protein